MAFFFATFTESFDAFLTGFYYYYSDSTFFAALVTFLVGFGAYSLSY
jgi:hypothetical protein